MYNTCQWVIILLNFTANDHTAVLFILGTDITLSIDEKLELQEEDNFHGDLIRVDGLTEHYNNLTLKTLYTLKFFLKNGQFIIISVV